jgi:hypothetical protein
LGSLSLTIPAAARPSFQVRAAASLSGIPLIAADRDERVFRPGEIKTRSFRIADDMTIIGYCFSPQIQSVIPIAAERRNPQLLILESPELSICE